MSDTAAGTAAGSATPLTDAALPPGGRAGAGAAAVPGASDGATAAAEGGAGAAADASGGQGGVGSPFSHCSLQNLRLWDSDMNSYLSILHPHYPTFFLRSNHPRLLPLPLPKYETLITHSPKSWFESVFNHGACVHNHTQHTASRSPASPPVNPAQHTHTYTHHTHTHAHTSWTLDI